MKMDEEGLKWIKMVEEGWLRIEVDEDVYGGRANKKKGKRRKKHLEAYYLLALTLNWIQKYLLNHIKVILPWVYSFFIFPCKISFKDPNSSMVLARFDSTLFMNRVKLII